jgi:hypothetical protein
MKHVFSVLAITALACVFQPAEAATGKALHKHAKPMKNIAAADNSEAFDTSAATATEFDCELGRKVTVYTNAADNRRIGLRWKQKLHRLDRVDTQSGADRFEDARNGLVWIGIPSKSMLLDSKKGQQLANECHGAPPQHNMPQS